MAKKIAMVMALVFAFCLVCQSCTNPAQRDNILDNTPVSSSVSEEAQDAAAVSKLSRFQIPYNKNESFSPFLVTSTDNIQMMPLLFEGLVSLDENFTPVMRIAENISLSATQCEITLRQGYMFSDGSPLTAEDVVFTINTLLTAQCYYSKQVTNISSAKKTGAYSLQITLKQADSMFIRLLDFPIVKKDSPDTNAPIGSGRYVVSNEDGQSILKSNGNYQGGKELYFDKIQLVDLPDSEAMVHSVKAGAIDYTSVEAAELGEYSAGSSFAPYATNRLVFVGVNGGKAFLNDSLIRRVLFAAVDRADLVGQAYCGYASRSFFPFQPLYQEFSSLNWLADAYTQNQAKQWLTDNGYAYREGERIRQKDGKALQFSLLVNSENSFRNQSAALIKKQLEKIGIGIEIVKEDFTKYKEKLAAGDYDLFLGEISLPANMDIAVLLDPAKVLAASLCTQTQVLDSYNRFKNGSGSLEDFMKAFEENVPFIPLLFSQNAAVYSKEISFKITPTQNNIFYSILYS